ncbi:hypothetical protein LW867_000508 [Campylobacter jejuni]|nr:hypothetical protein [Campylobacter jejuni]
MFFLKYPLQLFFKISRKKEKVEAKAEKEANKDNSDSTNIDINKKDKLLDICLV